MRNMKIGSLFSGIGGIELGLENASSDFETAWQVEINTYAKSILAKHWPKAEFMSDVKDVVSSNLEKVDLICGGFPCFAKDTMILTENGYIPIQNVVIGEKVMTHLGRWRKVTSVMTRKAKTVELKAIGLPPVITTENHPFYASENVSAPGRKRSLGKPFWLSASKMKGSFASSRLPRNDKPSSFSDDMLWVMGYYLAEGWRTVSNGKGRVVMCASHAEANYVEKNIKKVYPTACKCKERTGVKFHITQKAAHQLFAQFGDGAKNKRLPSWIMQLPEKQAESFLSGYIYGDGDSSQGYERTSTISKALALSVMMVGWKARGVVPAVFLSKKKKKCVIEGRVVNQNHTYLVCLYKRNKCTAQQGSLCWKRVNKLRQKSEKTVFNISVEQDESYVADGYVVHNCKDVSNSKTAKESPKGLEGKESGLWFEMNRIIAHKKPRLVLIENVGALRSRGLDVVLANLDENGYDAEWAILSSGALGLNHMRKRLFIVAGLRKWLFPAPWADGCVEGTAFAASDIAGRIFHPQPKVKKTNIAEPVLLSKTPTSEQKLRIEALGNCVTPVCAEFIGKRLMKANKLKRKKGKVVACLAKGTWRMYGGMSFLEPEDLPEMTELPPCGVMKKERGLTTIEEMHVWRHPSCKYRTPTARDHIGLSALSWRTREVGDKTPTLPDQLGAIPDPDWLEALMGFPYGWTKP